MSVKSTYSKSKDRGTIPCGVHRSIVLCLMVVMTMTNALFADDLRNDGFESYSEGQTFTISQNGWLATTNSVKVQTTVVEDGSQAVVIPCESELGNTVSAVGVPRVWVDQQLIPTLGAQPADAPDSGETARMYFNFDGYVAVYSNGIYDVCSNDVYGVAILPATGQWVRVSLHQDFTAQQASLFLDGRLLRQEMPFIGNVPAFNKVNYRNDNDSTINSNGYLDVVLISTNLPTSLESAADGDGDGMADAKEIHLYGNVDTYGIPHITVTTNVIGIVGQVPGTVTPNGSFDMSFLSDTNFVITANPAFIVSDIVTNGTSVGTFTGQNTRNASWAYDNVSEDTTVQIEFTYTATRDVPADYATIAAAVTAALTNDVIVVSNATYALSAPIVVTVPMTITGDTNTPANVVLTAPTMGDDKDIFQVRANGVTIQGFSMSGVANGVSPNAGWINAAIMVGNDSGNALMASPGIIEGLTNSVFRYNEYTGCSCAAYLHQTTNVVGRFSAIVGSTTGVWANAETDWTTNWWGDINGPSGIGPGGGDAVSANVLYSPWWSDAVGSHLVYYVANGESIQNSLDCALTGDYVMVAAGSYTENLTFNYSVNLMGGDIVLVGDISLSAGITLTMSSALTANNLTVANGAVVLVTPSVTVTDLTIATGGTLEVQTGTLTIGATELIDSFTLDETWGTGLVAQELTFEDGFESYGDGARMDKLGAFGWDASTADVVVQTSTKYKDSKAVEIPMDTSLSNAITTVATKTWTDLYLIPPLGPAPDDTPAVDESLRMYFTTNGYISIATNGGWDICEEDAFGEVVTPVSDEWVRLTVHHDYVNEQIAVMLNGRVLRVELPFLGNSVSYNNMELRNTATASAFIDGVSISINTPSGLNEDVDGDGLSDAYEIAEFGDLSHPDGTLFKFR